MTVSESDWGNEGSRGHDVVAPDRWRVRVLGPLLVEGEKTHVDTFPTRRAALVLIRLALAQGHPVTREALCQELWPDEFLDVTRPRLRQELNRLKSALGPAEKIIAATRLTLRLDTSVVDLDLKRAEGILFKIRVETDDAKKLQLYERLAEFSGDLAGDYEEAWIESARANWRDRLARHLLDAAHLSKEQALHFTWRAASIDVLNESVQSEYLELLVELGRPQEAASRLADLDQLYRNVLGAGPSDRLKRLVKHSVRSESAAVSRSSVPIQAPLPAALIQLVGRQEEIESIVETLKPDSDTRLITLCGPGGVGKTELAMAAGRRLWNSYNQRLWFIALAGVSQPGFIGNAIQEAIGVSAIGTDPVETLSSSFSGGPSLLILDNLEQLVDGGAQIVRRLLELCPELKLLVTSRRKLLIEGEFPFSVPVLGQEEAVELFCNVARRTRASFAPTEEELAQVATLVSPLDRLPLAIQLAASRLGVLSVYEMSAQLSKRFDLLVSGRSDVEPRHQGLRQTIAWSFDQLAPEAKQFLLDLSIFRGGWTAALAMEVLDNDDALRLLEELRASSFVYEETADTEMRFNMLHSIREFAQERQNPKRAEKQLRKMSATILRLLTEADSRLLKEDQMRWYMRIEREHDNIRRVLEFASKEDADTGILLCEKLWRFWSIRGHNEEARVWAKQLLTRETTPSYHLGIALFGAGRCAEDQGRMNEAEDWYLRSRQVGIEIGDSRLSRLVNLNLSGVYLSRGQFEEAKKMNEATLAQLVELGEAYGEGIVRESLAIAYMYLGQFEDAATMAAASLEALNRREDRIALASASLTLAQALVKLGRLEEARLRIESELEVHISNGYHAGIAYAKRIMAELLLREGRLDEAEAACEESERECVAIGDRFGIGMGELLLAEIAKHKPDPDARQAHLAKARANFRSGGCEALMDHDLFSLAGPSP